MKTLITSALLVSMVGVVNLNALTINNLLDDALTTNPIILERIKNYDKTVYDLKIAKSGYQPTLNYVGKFGYEKTLDQVGPTGEVGYHTYQNSLILTQNLFNGLNTTYKVKFEEARVMAAAYNYVEQTNDVAFNIVKNYINVLKYNELFNLEKENVLLTQDILGKTKQLSDAGSGLISDVRKVDSSLQLAEFNLLTQENNLLDAQFNLNKLLGRKIKKEELEYPDFNASLPKNMEDALNHAIKYNPSILVTNYNIETAKAQLVQNRSKFSPTVDFELAYNFDRNTSGDEGHTRSYSALVVYRHNLYNGQADINAVRKSKMNVKQEYELQREIKRQLIESLQLSWSAYTMIEKQIDFLNSYKRESKATLDFYKEEFENGTRTLIDLLSAQDDYISAQSKLITANYDWLFSKYRILDAMGVMLNTIFDGKTSKYYAPTSANYGNIEDYELQDISDIDRDGVKDNFDLCDSTPLGIKVDMFGCAIKNEEIVEAVPTNVISIKNFDEKIIENTNDNLKENTFEDIFLTANKAFTLNLATFSSKKVVDRFLENSKLDKNKFFVINYRTKNSVKDLYKIVYGVYDSKKEAMKELSSLAKIVKINKPYISNIENIKENFLN